MAITKKRLLIGLLVLVVLGTAIATGTVIAGKDKSPNEPDIRVAQYRVEADKKVLYAVAYGIKPNGVLRIEVPDITLTSIQELNPSNLSESTPAKIRIFEVPAGKWRLYDRITEKEIKFKGR